jgi:hypothetical protein
LPAYADVVPAAGAGHTVYGWAGIEYRAGGAGACAQLITITVPPTISPTISSKARIRENFMGFFSKSRCVKSIGIHCLICS